MTVVDPKIALVCHVLCKSLAKVATAVTKVPHISRRMLKR